MKPPAKDPKPEVEVLEDIAGVPDVLRPPAGKVLSDISEGMLLADEEVLVLVWL